jgi:hypothetical protein
MPTVIVFSGETAGQAESRTARWHQERRELLGWTGNSFVVKGRRCTASYGYEPTNLIYSPESVTAAEQRHRDQLAAERNSLIRARARREARTLEEFGRLVTKYGAV